MVSFRVVTAPGTHVRADLMNHGAEVMGDTGVGEAKYGITIQLQLHIPTAVRLKPYGVAVLGSVDLDHAPFVRPQQIQPYGRGELIRAVVLIPAAPGRPRLPSQRGFEGSLGRTPRMRPPQLSRALGIRPALLSSTCGMRLALFSSAGEMRPALLGNVCGMCLALIGDACGMQPPSIANACGIQPSLVGNACGMWPPLIGNAGAMRLGVLGDVTG